MSRPPLQGQHPHEALQGRTRPPASRSPLTCRRAVRATTTRRQSMAVVEEERVSTTVPLNWDEVWFTNCPMVSANNVDQELGWCREEFKKIGVEYAYFRHAPENNWYPHYIHNLDNLIRFGGLYPPIHVHADLRRTVLLGATWVYEGGCMAVRARDDDLPDGGPEGQEDRHLEEPEHDQERLVAHPGAHGHREHAHAARHDHGRRRAGRVPVSGRLVRQARDAPGDDEQPVRAVDAARPQARPGLPPAGDGAPERHRRRHLHPEQGLPASPGGHGQASR